MSADIKRKWGRLYAGTRNHRKIKILADRHPNLWWVWYVFLDMSIEIDDDGWIYIMPDVPYTFKELAKEVRIKREDHLKEVCKSLEDLGMIAVTDRGIQVLSYSERNFDSDISTERVRKYRERQNNETFQKQSRNTNETKDETSQIRLDKIRLDNNIKDTPIIPKGDKPNGFNISRLASIWNEKSPPQLAKVNLPFKRNPTKLKKLNSMLTLYPDENWWIDLFTRIQSSSFLCGHNDRGWKANFDFIVSKADEISDGKYFDNNFKPQNNISRTIQNLVAFNLEEDEREKRNL